MTEIKIEIGDSDLKVVADATGQDPTRWLAGEVLAAVERCATVCAEKEIRELGLSKAALLSAGLSYDEIEAVVSIRKESRALEAQAAAKLTAIEVKTPV